MAKTSTVAVPLELEKVFSKSVQLRDRYILGVAQSQRRIIPKNKKYELVNGSLFRYLSPFWKAFTPEQRDIWKLAGAISRLSGWQLFISDSANRLKNTLEIIDTPNLLWQVRIGLIEINAPASGIFLHQEHPRNYLEIKKIAGTPWKYETVNIEEIFYMPLRLEIRYYADLSAYGPTQSAKYYATVQASYQGIIREHQIGINIEIMNEWTYAEAELTDVRGIITGYDLYIEIEGYRGKIMLDNIRAIHGGTNWARDPRFDNMNRRFVKQFRLVQPYWKPIIMESGASYRTVFEPIVDIG